MQLDIRVPIGLMFSILGALLLGYGLLGDARIYARSLGYNVNVSWGATVLVFGLLMLFFGRRATMRGPGSAPPSDAR